MSGEAKGAAPPLVHHFDAPLPLDGRAARRWLGGKGASVAQMTAMGLPVPAGFTLSTDVWRHYRAHGQLPSAVLDRLAEHVARIEEATGRRYGDGERPLLLAVRSGAPSSMPGMLETVLDVGVSSDTVRGLRASYGDERFALDVHRRFLESYATVVLGVPRAAFDALLGRREANELDVSELRGLVAQIERTVAHEVGGGVPDDPMDQLRAAIEGVLRSWRSDRAAKFRDAHGIAGDEGTGVTVQAMVYGNLPDGSGAGVVFSRNPSTGERALWGEWLAGAQGEDVVSGRRTPDPLTRAQVRRGMDDRGLEGAMPDLVARLGEVCALLEERYGDVQDVEFTIERGALFVLQCRAAKRTPRAAVRVASEMTDEGALSRAAALQRLEPASLRQLLTPRLPDPEVLAAQDLRPLARGLAASPGAASGKIVLDTESAQRARGEELVLVRAETSAEDVAAMRHVTGILTAAGGLTSHAAVVARAMGKPCVAGATSLHVDYVGRRVLTRDGFGTSFGEGDVLTIDGTRGLVYEGAVAVEPAPASEHVTRVLEWAREACRAEILAVGGLPRQVRVGRSFGADGALLEGVAAADLPALREAVGQGALYLVLDEADPATLQALAAALRPTDALLVDAAPPAALAARIYLRRGPDEWRAQQGEGVVLRGDERAEPRLRALRAEGAEPLTIAVPPLDVPVARLLAAQIDGAREP